MTKRLEGKVAVITGAASGMGLASVELFIEHGASVVAADIQVGQRDELTARFGEAVRFIKCDVSVESDVKAAVDLAISAFGRLDVMFNNAGIPGTPASLAEMDAGEWDKVMAIDLRSVMFGIRYATPHLQKRGGSIINTSSGAGLRSSFGHAAYSIAKAGVAHLSKVAASELGKDNIRVNTIVPGWVTTPIWGSHFSADREKAERIAHELEQGFAKLQPIPRAGCAQDIAKAALFLASDDSSWISGIDLIVDGGLMVQRRSETESGTPNSIADLLTRVAQDTGAL